MPSFTSVAALAIGLLSLSSPAFASTSEHDIAARGVSFNDDVFAGAALAKRRPNHANAYGYPHDVGPHTGKGKAMTPGGYKNPKPVDIGRTGCKKDSDCSTGSLYMAAAVCTVKDKVGTCGFRCLGDTVKSGNGCVGVFSAPECKKNSDCSSPAHGSGLCLSGTCSFKCHDGYVASSDKCVADSNSCGGKKCPITVINGYNACSPTTDECVPSCATYLGYQLYRNKAKTVYKCIDTQSDVDNCGTPGNVCPEGYNGLGVPTCSSGVCGLNCSGYKHKLTHKGAAYCTDN